MRERITDKRDESDGSQPPSAATRAKPAQSAYSRNLPHVQNDGDTLFVTFSTRKRWVLPAQVRADVLRHCLHDHGVRIRVHAVVVMPDHIHMIFTPLKDAEGETFGLAEIMGGIKGAAAHTVNRMLRRRGPVWELESFDRVMRSDENAYEKGEYICANPVRAGLAEREADYPWLWREWIEGREA